MRDVRGLAGFLDRARRGLAFRHRGVRRGLAARYRIDSGDDVVVHVSLGARVHSARILLHRQVVLLDEPTRGLDYPTKARLSAILRDLADSGHAVALATHDVELVAETADRVAMLADGELVAQGPTSDVITSSPLFSPQVTKVVAPEPFLTVEDVDRALQTEPETA